MKQYIIWNKHQKEYECNTKKRPLEFNTYKEASLYVGEKDYLEIEVINYAQD